MNQFSKVAAEDMARPWVLLALIVIPIVGCADAADDSQNSNAVMLNADAGTQRTMDPGSQIDIQDERQADPRTPSEERGPADAGVLSMTDARMQQPDSGGGERWPGEASEDGHGRDACDLVGIQADRSFAEVTDFGLQHVAMRGNEESFVVTQLFAEFGAPQTPGRYALDGINYRDCGLCLIAQRGCLNGQCEQTFYADEGTVVITEIGDGRLSGYFEDVVFHEVNIDPNTHVSTRLPDGDSWCMEPFAFDSTYEGNRDNGEMIRDNGGHPDNPQVCLEPVACAGETMPDFELLNCATEQYMSMREHFSDERAGVIVTGSGWCPNCADLLPRTAQIQRENANTGVKFAYILGQDENYQPATLNYCRQYAARLNLPIDRMFIDPGHERTYENVWPYPDEQGAVGIPFKSIVDVGTWTIYYSDRAPGWDFAEAINAAISQ